MSTNKNPCYQCPERTITCHSDCSKYSKYKELIDSANEKKRIENESYITSPKSYYNNVGFPNTMK